MDKEGIAPSAISAFESTFNSLLSGNTGMIPEDTISAVPDLDRAENLNNTPNTALLSQTVVLKLNGGLGTGMGLDKAKSLLKVKGEDTFLDLTAKQVIQMRQDYGFKVKFMLMNSFSTSEDTLAFFREKYPALAGEDGLEMMQNKIPKIRADNLEVRLWSRYPKKIPSKNRSSRMVTLIFLNHSPPLARLTLPTNGALPGTVTCTLPWSDRAASIVC